MRIGRTILVAILAVAIGMLPASMSLAYAAPAANTITAAAQDMPDCDHHKHQQQTPAKQTQKTDNHGTCVVSCAFCIGFVGAELASFAYVLPASAALQLMRAHDHISSLMGSAPFRPPRA